MEYLKPTDDYWVIDIEGDLIPSTRIWCIVLEQVTTETTLKFGPDDLGRFVDWHRANPSVVYVGHNALSYDIPTLNRILGTSISLRSVVDTLVLSYLYHPRMPGGHSVEAYGERFKEPKSSYSDFSRFTPELLERCAGDVKIQKRIYNALRVKMLARGFSNMSCDIEHRIRVVLDKQKANGWFFDTEGARQLYTELRERQLVLERVIHKLFPPTLEQCGTYTFKVKQDGSPYASYLRHVEQYPKVELDVDGGTYRVFDYKTFNVGSPSQRVDKLLSLGWVPQQFTAKGNPSIDEDSILDFAKRAKENREAIEAIAEWIVIQGRATMVQGWLNNVKSDSRIHGTVFTCGAATRRMTHNNPNSANIPKAKESVPYGIRCRQLWCTPPGRVLVGYDAKGLEMRMFAHYLNNPEATELYINGDPHQANADLIGIGRDPVKNVFYAWLYGAGDAKLGWTADTSIVGPRRQAKRGKEVRQLLVEVTPGLDNLLKRIQSEGQWLSTVDGGFVRCEADNAVLNYKLQSAGAIVMKVAAILLDERIQERGLDAIKVADVHDEGQLECSPECAEEVGKLAVQCVIDAGAYLNLNVPLDANYAIGPNWALTH